MSIGISNGNPAFAPPLLGDMHLTFGFLEGVGYHSTMRKEQPSETGEQGLPSLDSATSVTWLGLAWLALFGLFLSYLGLVWLGCLSWLDSADACLYGKTQTVQTD
jgi:hypothetical protein